MAEGYGRRRRFALLVSLVVHLCLLAPLLLIPVGPRPTHRPTRGDVQLGLVSEAGLESGPSRARPAPASGLPSHVRPILQPSTTPRAATSAAAIAPALQPPTPHGAGAATSSGGGQGASSAAGSGDQAAVRRALQAALACAPGGGRPLDDEARAACRKRLIEGAAAMGEAKVDTIPPLKRAYYDAVQKAYQDFRSFPTPDTTLTHLPGAEGMYDQRLAHMPGHAAGVGCGLKFGGPHSLKLKVGPITCAVVLPSSPLDPEVDLPNADQIPGK